MWGAPLGKQQLDNLQVVMVHSHMQWGQAILQRGRGCRVVRQSLSPHHSFLPQPQSNPHLSCCVRVSVTCQEQLCHIYLPILGRNVERGKSFLRRKAAHHRVYRDDKENAGTSTGRGAAAQEEAAPSVTGTLCRQPPQAQLAYYSSSRSSLPWSCRSGRLPSPARPGLCPHAPLWL